MNKIILLNTLDNFKVIQLFGLTDFAKENGHKYYRAYGGRHPGIDYTLKTYSDRLVRAVHSGVIVKDDDIDDSGAGINLSLFCPEQLIATKYFHLVNNNIKEGDRIAAGDVLGIMGNTGASEGIHLHFGLYRTDSQAIIINKDNGLKGAINPFDFDFVYWHEWDGRSAA